MRVESGGLVSRPVRNSVEAPLRFYDTGELLWRVPQPFRVVGLATDALFDPYSPFVLSEPRRSWFFERRLFIEAYYLDARPFGGSLQVFYVTNEKHSMERFDHPFVRTFRHVLSSEGFDGFYQPALQRDSHPERFDLLATYNPSRTMVRWAHNNDIVDFRYESAYGIYNWELFYHLPLFIAGRLSQNQRFDEARRWFHYIFDPTRASGEPAPQRFWITRPLAELTESEIQAQRINQLLKLVNQGDDAAQEQVREWRRDPFNPYLLADQRPVAYMKRVVMSYLDNLIAWGDALFVTASREALNEATQLYVLAAELLGSRPYLVPPPSRAAKSWTELAPDLDAFANAFVQVENLVPAGVEGTGRRGGEPLPAPTTFYFKIPPNEKLLGYWDTVQDRLFKLRHCLGLGGEPLALPLFDAPIDPALLVRARAAGLDIGRVLLDLGAPVPGYRFTELHRRAVEYTGAVQDLGQKLLAAIEARDAEALAMLLLSQRRRIHAETREILEWQFDEAEELHAAIGVGIELAEYQYRTANEAPLMSNLEVVAVGSKNTAIILKGLAAFIYGTAGKLEISIPEIAAGTAGMASPVMAMKHGGTVAGNAAAKEAKALEAVASGLDSSVELMKIFIDGEKRQKQNKQAKEEAAFRRREAERQQKAAHFRRLIVQDQLKMHDRAAEDLDAEQEFLRMKFGNEALYDWMVGQLSSLYFSAFRLAMAMARRAERCYRFELGLTESSIIGSNGWDSLRRGLLAGEELANDLRRLESSYLDQNVRRKEITRTISLRAEFPECLLALLVRGECNLELDELLFDRDYPGHYQRRITRASITVERPGAAPHDNVVCVATLLHNTVRLVSTIGDGYERGTGPEADTRFADGFAAVQGIVTGNAIDDPGLFVRDIAENLADPRYLPFENAGVIGEWRIELPASRNALDLSTVTDVKLHLHYTALDGSAVLRNAAEAAVKADTPDAVEVAFDARGQFPEAWARFMAGGIEGEQRFVLPLRPGLLPPAAREGNPQITACELYLLHDDPDLKLQTSLLSPFPPSLDDEEQDGVVTRHRFKVDDPGLPVQPLSVRVREQGASGWASLAPERLNGMIIAVEFSIR
jgi:hypothetical protein